MGLHENTNVTIVTLKPFFKQDWKSTLKQIIWLHSVFTKLVLDTHLHMFELLNVAFKLICFRETYALVVSRAPNRDAKSD